jgi:hypothetical protein
MNPLDKGITKVASIGLDPYITLTLSGSTVVEHSPRHLKVKGLSLATAAGTEGRKWRNKYINFYPKY